VTTLLFAAFEGAMCFFHQMENFSKDEKALQFLANLNYEMIQSCKELKYKNSRNYVPGSFLQFFFTKTTDTSALLLNPL